MGDINDDGFPDVVVSRTGGIRALIGNGTGVTEAGGTGQFPSARALVIAEANSDAFSDVLVAMADRVALLPSEGDGTLSAPVPVITNLTMVRDMDAGDIDGDGQVDIVYVTANDEVGVALGNGVGFGAVQERRTDGSSPRAIVVDDFTNDGRADVAVALSSEPNSVEIFAGLPDGTLADPSSIAVSGRPAYVASGDVNGDDVPDLALTSTSSEQVTIVLSNP